MSEDFGICPIHGLGCPEDCSFLSVIPCIPEEERQRDADAKQRASKEKEAASSAMTFQEEDDDVLD